MRIFRFHESLITASIATVLAVGTAAAAAAAENCTLTQIASLDLSDDYAVVVPVTINGTQARMLVDTGGAMSAVFSDAGTRLGLHSTTQVSADEGAIDLRGQTLTELVTIPELGLGNMRGHNLPFMWLPRAQHPAQFDGILAPDLLRRYDVDIDFANRKLKLFSTEHCPGRVVYWASAYDSIPASVDQSGHIETPVLLDGKEIRATVDTGAYFSALSTTRAYQLFNLDENSPGVEKFPGSTADSLVHYQYRFRHLSFGAVQVSNPVVAFLPDDAAHTARLEEDRRVGDPALKSTIDGPVFLLGLNILRKLHLYIAYGEQKMYFTAADAGDAAASSGAATANAK